MSSLAPRRLEFSFTLFVMFRNNEEVYIPENLEEILTQYYMKKNPEIAHTVFDIGLLVYYV